MKIKIVTLAFLFTFLNLTAQQKNIDVAKISNTSKIKIDGALDDEAWGKASPSGKFWEQFPSDTNIAHDQTEIRMLYDDKYLYIGAKVYTSGSDFNTISLMRDYKGSANDAVHFLFDTYDDNNNAFYFGVTPFGVVRDGLLSRGGVKGEEFLDFFWDTTWIAESKIYDDRYEVELRIPFFAFRYNDNVKKWGFNSYRNDVQTQVNSTWCPIPITQELQNLGYSGTMTFEKPVKKSRTPFSIIPYALVSGDQDSMDGDGKFEVNPGIGADVKIPIGSTLNLDLTVNPDFSNTSVNQGKTNTTRFELDFPEQRQFFLDNSDLFSGFGYNKQANPFYSRRIGFAKDTLGNDIQNDILAGARLSGKIGEDFRIGFLNVQTAEDAKNEVPSNNNMVLALQQKVFDKSNVSFIFTNRQSVGDYEYVETADIFNRVAGIDYNYYSKNNLWTGNAYFHKSFTKDAGNDDNSWGGILTYNSKTFLSETSIRSIGEDFRADLGFIKRTNSFVVNEKIGPVFYPKNENITGIGVFFKTTGEFVKSTGENTDHNFGGLMYIKFKNSSVFRSEFQHQFIRLDSPFDPLRTGVGEIPIGDYTTWNWYVKFNSNTAKTISTQSRIQVGTYYNGTKTSGEFKLDYRIQPYFNTSLVANFDYIELPYDADTIMYIGPQFEFTFTRNIFWTTDVQYNSQDETFGMNSRLQWRFRPLSDLFLIYTDGYNTMDEINHISRSIFLKATFWLNI